MGNKKNTSSNKFREYEMLSRFFNKYNLFSLSVNRTILDYLFQNSSIYIRTLLSEGGAEASEKSWLLSDLIISLSSAASEFELDALGSVSSASCTAVSLTSPPGSWGKGYKMNK